MSDVLLIDNSIQQETVLVPVTAVQPDLVTQTDVVVYVPLASKNAHGIVKIGEGLNITPDGLLSFDRSEVTIKEIALNGNLLVPVNKRVNIILSKNDVGLDNVDNTSDLDKPISTATQTALDELDTNLTDDILDVDDRLIDHINDFGNPHRVTKTQVGLSNVDNTSDLDKPISRATQRELTRIQGLIKGSEGAVSYDSYKELIDEFNVLEPDVYNVGQSIYIKTLKVPDLWVYDVEEESEEFVYIDDSTIESILKIDGTFKVGYYRLAALDTLKVDLSNYVTIDGVQSISGDKDFTGLLTLNNVRIATEDDLPKEYIKNASVDGNTLTITNQDDNTIDFVGEPAKYVKSVTSENGILTLTDQDDNEITFSSKEPDLSGYLPLTAGSEKQITGALYVKSSEDSVWSNDVGIVFDSGATIGSLDTGTLGVRAKGSFYIRINDATEINIDASSIRPSTKLGSSLGTSSYQWLNLYAQNIYQNGKPVANAENLSAVTDATLSDDNKTLTITKRDGTSFDFQGGGGGDVDLSGYVTTNTAQTITGAKAFVGQVGNEQTEAGVYLGLDANAEAPNANIAITSANTAAYIDMGRPNVDYDFRIIKWNTADNKHAQLVYAGNASGTITIPQATGVMALTSDIPSKVDASNPNVFIGYNSEENKNSEYQVAFKGNDQTNGICWSKFANMSNEPISPSACTYNGFFYVNSSVNSLSGADANPFLQYHSEQDFRILTTAYSDQWLQQKATDFRTDHIFTRRRENGTWTDWTEIAKLSDTYQSKQTITTSGAVTQTIQPNVKYEFTGDLTSLTLTMAAPVSGRRNIYSVSFKTGASMNSIKITPASGFLKYGLCTPRSLDVNTNYLVEIEDNLAIISPVYSTFVVSTKTSIEGTTTSGSNGGSLIVIYNDTGEQIDTLVDAGAEVLINANPSTNYSLYRLIVNDTIVSNNHVQNITDDTEISAIFLGNTTTITWSVPTGVSSVTVTRNGTAISSGATVRFGDVISVSATAATGYTVTKSSTGLSGTASGYVNAANPTITFTATASS